MHLLSFKTSILKCLNKILPENPSTLHEAITKIKEEIL